nr:uncharacterized protein LOC109776623 [Aegilops tauschii subsp. strangulata]
MAKADASDAGSFSGAMFTSDRLNELHIKDHVPVILDLDSPSYNTWRTYFALMFRSYRLIEHVDGSVDFRDMKDDDEWLAVDACIVKWLFLTISGGLFNKVNARDSSAYAMWTRLCHLFLDNQLQHRVFLQGEFFTMQQNDLSIDEYCTRLKVLADELHNVGMTIDDSVLLTNLLRGLHPDLGQSAANLSLVTPTYAKAVTYLSRRPTPPSMSVSPLATVLRQLRHHHACLLRPRHPRPRPPVDASRRAAGVAAATPTQRRALLRQPRPPLLRRGSRGIIPGRGLCMLTPCRFPAPPPAPSILGPRPSSHQALLTAPAPAAYGNVAAYSGPSAYGGHPGYGAYGGAPPVYDPALLSALHAAPSPSTYNGGGDWRRLGRAFSCFARTHVGGGLARPRVACGLACRLVRLGRGVIFATRGLARGPVAVTRGCPHGLLFATRGLARGPVAVTRGCPHGLLFATRGLARGLDAAVCGLD